MTNKIVITVLDQFSKTSICEFVSRYSVGHDAEFHLIHVLESVPPSIEGSPKWQAAREKHERSGQSILSQLSAALKSLVPDAQFFEHLKNGNPADEIIELAKETRASLIVLGTRGRRGLMRLLLGSVSSEVANNAPCSVVILKQNQLAFSSAEKKIRRITS